MNELFEKLLSGLKGTSTGTRLVVGLVGVSLAAILGLAAVVTHRPHFELAFSGLTDHELAQVCKALSDAGIPFEQSQPPGPFSVYVDRQERSGAYMAAYGAGALDKPLEGIISEAGVSTVFNSSEERAQSVRKREWQEMENMLEELDFVAGARVRTSVTGTSVLAGGRAPTSTASVTLRLGGTGSLTPAQSATIANLVSRGLGIPKTALVISDQAGHSLYDGEDSGGSGREVKDMLAHQGEHDRRLASEANAVLEQILGPNKARVSVTSEWDYAQSTTRSETVDKKATVVQESKTTSEKPVGNAAAVPAGLSSNTLDATATEASSSADPAAAPLMEKTSEERKDYAPSIAREERVRVVPELKRLSVALFLDQSVEKEAAKLEGAIKAAVGFDSERRDEFSAVVLPFVAPPEPAPESVEAPAAEPSPLLEMLLGRGVEIVSAVAFLVLLMKTLRGGRKTAAPSKGAPAARPDEKGYDPELVARAQIDELLRSDPARVGEILSRWVREEPVTSGR